MKLSNTIHNKFILICYKDEQIRRTVAYPRLKDAQDALAILSKDYTSGQIFVEHKETE